jgi:integrase
MKRAEKADATINRSTQLLTQSFARAVARKHLSSAPQIRHLSEKGNARKGFFGDAEFRAVESHLPTYLRDFARFSYLTAWRKGEIASLRWEDVDGDIIALRAENSKNGEARKLTLDGQLGELIERRRCERQVKKDGGVILAAFVFHKDGLPVGDFRKSWAAACVAAQLGQFICPDCKQSVSGHTCPECKSETTYSGRLFHDLRRTGARNMVRAGVGEKIAMGISGHKTRSIFDRYNIVDEADLREAMQRTQDYLKSAAESQKRPAIMRQTGTEN